MAPSVAMELELEKRLRKIAADDREVEQLHAQWIFDEPIVGQALNAVATWFPHYSRHDSSHSRKVLANIERFLGTRRISLLSGTDIWLLLESAYWHDIGMVIPDEDVRELVGKPNFLSHLDVLERSGDPDLRAAASVLRRAGGGGGPAFGPRDLAGTQARRQ